MDHRNKERKMLLKVSYKLCTKYFRAHSSTLQTAMMRKFEIISEKIDINRIVTYVVRSYQ
jgi:hypothetical protein